MLNRRTLRIKIMQSLFAFDQCKEANHELAHDLIEERFQPDLNSMEVQDKDLLKKQSKAARQLFEKKFKGLEPNGEHDPKVEKVVDEALERYNQQVKKDQDFLSRNIILEIEKLTNLYHSVLSLLVEFTDLAKAEKKVNHAHFYNHPCIKAIATSEELNAQLLRSNSGWQKNTDQVRGWFSDVIKTDDDYQEFIAMKKPD